MTRTPYRISVLMGWWPFSLRLRWDELQLLSEQLESMVQRGLPLPGGLQAMARDLQNPRLRSVLVHLRNDLLAGVSLEDAVARQQERFPPFYPGLFRAGVASGKLPRVLRLIRDHAVFMTGVRRQAQIALLYPVLLTIVAAAVISFMLVWCVPVFGDIYGEMGGSLPAPARFLLAASDWLRAYGPGLLMLGAMIAIFGSAAAISLRFLPWGRYWLDLVKRWSPWVGPSHHRLVQSRFCRLLGLLLASRVPVLSALDLAGAASGSAVLMRSLGAATSSVAAGGAVSAALERTGYFGADVCWLLAVGEERGDLEEVLENLATRFDDELTATTSYFGTLALPIFILAIGFIMYFVVMGLYSPMFTIGDAL